MNLVTIEPCYEFAIGEYRGMFPVFVCLQRLSVEPRPDGREDTSFDNVGSIIGFINQGGAPAKVTCLAMFTDELWAERFLEDGRGRCAAGFGVQTCDRQAAIEILEQTPAQ